MSDTECKAFKKDDYTDSSYAEYEKALKEVKAVIAKEIVTKDEVNAAREKIVEGAVSMVKMALHKLSEEEIVDRNILSVENGEGKYPVTLQWVVSDEGREED